METWWQIAEESWVTLHCDTTRNSKCH